VQVLEHLRRLKHALRIATLIVSHQPDEVVALADEEILLKAGQMAGRLDVAAFGSGLGL
jgi:ABC-type molybdate transport system ATPase subunit